jgi:hypothetical protein
LYCFLYQLQVIVSPLPLRWLMCWMVVIGQCFVHEVS